jgi:tripartite-type tricarboxylate transporter receptor subunit TctC
LGASLSVPPGAHHWALGGGLDITARLIGQLLQERLGQPFIVENRPGADSNTATEAVINVPPDGLLLAALLNASAALLNASNATRFD